MEVASYFNDFLKNIRLSDSQVGDLKTGHSTLRDRLNDDEEISEIMVTTFLHGSYRRSTAVRPKGDKRPDVDVVVVTNLDHNEVEPDEALEKFRPFLEQHYKGKYRKQGRSWGISLSYVDLDLVPVAAPSEAVQEQARAFAATDKSLDESSYQGLFHHLRSEAKWKTEPLWIPDRDADKWVETDPLAQIEWTWDKNASCNGHYVNVVKALKWWRLDNNPDGEHPKSYPLEHLIGTVCPNGIDSIAEGVTSTLETVVAQFPNKPVLLDRGLPQDVFERITQEEYGRFYDLVKGAASLARRALDADTIDESVRLWRELFGNKFPPPPEGAKATSPNNDGSGGYTDRRGRTVLTGGRYA